MDATRLNPVCDGPCLATRAVTQLRPGDRCLNSLSGNQSMEALGYPPLTANEHVFDHWREAACGQPGNPYSDPRPLVNLRDKACCGYTGDRRPFVVVRRIPRDSDSTKNLTRGVGDKYPSRNRNHRATNR